MRPFLLILTFCALSLTTIGQPSDYPYSAETYPFIRYDLNRIEAHTDDPAFTTFLSKLDTLLHYGDGRLSIVHFGGSHVQGGTFPREVMTRFAGSQQGLSLGTFYFPFAAANTNTPRGYSSEAWGNWKYCKNTDASRTCVLGASGISITTSDTSAGFSISPNPSIQRDELITLLVSPSSSYSLRAIDTCEWELVSESLSSLTYKALGPVSRMAFRVIQADTLGKELSMYGLFSQASQPGISYYALGINGAHLNSYISCEMLPEQLKMLNPDLVILSIGINDAHGNGFSSNVFKSKYEVLIQQIRQVCPLAAIMLTTNTDSYIRRRHLNQNALQVREAMIELSREQNCSLWDWFEVMGGLNSIRQWQDAGLAQGDRVHFTREGYSLSGDLLFEAILRSYEEHIQQIP